MSKRDEAKKANDHIISMADDYLHGIKIHIDYSRYVLKRKESALADKNFLDNAPDDIAEESAGKVVDILKRDEQMFQTFIPPLPAIAVEWKNILASGTATTTAFEMEAYSIYEYQVYNEEDTSWFKPVLEGYRKLAEDRVRNAEFPKRLEEFQEGLGGKFSIALKSIEQARASLLPPDLAVNHMRDVIDGLWGEIAKRSRIKNLKMFKGFSELSRARIKIRKLVAQCWSTTAEDESNLLVKLDSLDQLFREMSKRTVGKNILFNDIDKMNSLYDRWVIQLDTLIDEFRG